MRLRKEILAIAVPAIITNITTPLLGIADVAITGHIGDAVYIAAIAVGSTMFNILYWLLNFLRMGTSGITAQAYGAGDNAARDAVLFRSLALALILGFAVLILSHPLAGLILDFMDADDASAALALRYFHIGVWGAPAVICTYSMAGWLIGNQDSRSTLIIAVATNIINIALSICLVFGLGWKIEGVATGTAIAQWCGAIIAIVLIRHKYSPQVPALKAVLNYRQIVRFFKINSDIFIRTACLVAVTLWFTHAGAISGVDILAANALLLQFFMLFSFFMDGFAYAAEALAGKYEGKGLKLAVNYLARSLLRTGLVFALVFGILYLCFGEVFIELLTDRSNVRETASEYLIWAVMLPVCGFAAFVYDGLFVGLTRTRNMLVAMLVSVVVFFTVYFSSINMLGNHGLWLSFNAYLATRGIVEHIQFRYSSV